MCPVWLPDWSGGSLGRGARPADGAEWAALQAEPDEDAFLIPRTGEIRRGSLERSVAARTQERVVS